MTFASGMNLVTPLFDDEFIEKLKMSDDHDVVARIAIGELEYWLRQHFTRANPLAKQAITNIRNFVMGESNDE